MCGLAIENDDLRGYFFAGRQVYGVCRRLIEWRD
jgi:hypothetical protein